MRVLHVIASLSPRNGGLPRAAYHLARAEAAQGESIVLLGGKPRGEQESLGGSLHEPSSLRIETFSELPNGVRQLVTRPWSATLQRELVRSHLVHLHGVWDSPLLHAAYLARRANVPFVVTPHGMWSAWSLRQKRRKKLFAIRTSHGPLLGAAAAFHCLKQEEVEEVRHVLPAVRCFVVPNGVDRSGLDPVPNPTEFLALHPHLTQDHFFLFLSRLHHGKGLDILVEGYRRYRNRGGHYPLVIAGPDSGDGSHAKLLRELRRLDLQEHVTVPGPVYGKLKYSALRASAALVLPSRQEGFSVALLEGMACQRPLIAARTAAPRELREADVGWFPPLDPAGIAEAMDQVERDPSEAKRRAERGVELVRTRYNWTNVAAQMMAEYERLLAERG